MENIESKKDVEEILTGDVVAKTVPENPKGKLKDYLDKPEKKMKLEKKDVKVDRGTNLFNNKVEIMSKNLEANENDVPNYELLGAKPKYRRQNRQFSSEKRSVGQVMSNTTVSNDLEANTGEETGRLGRSLLDFDANLCKENSPVRAQIVRGTVALKKALFDELSKKEDDNERPLKRLQQSRLKPITPGSGSSTKKKRRKQKKSVALPSDQSLILKYLRGKGGEEKEL